MNTLRAITLLTLILVFSVARAAETTEIEKQITEVGSIPNEEIMVVQRKYTRKAWRHELTPITFGGIPFGTVRRTLVSGASYTLHANDWLGLELLNFTFSKNFFSSFTDDINNSVASGSNPLQSPIKPDFQKLLYFLTTGIQITPFYGKMSTFSQWIAYVEPYFTLGAGIAKTESDSYLTFYPGIGLRAYFREWFSLRVEFRDYIYTEKYITRENPPREASSMRNNYAVMVSLSFWLPKMPR